MLSRLSSWLSAWFIRGLHATLRVRHVNAGNLTGQKQYIIAFWHAHLLLMLHSKYREPIVVMISRSKDGEYIARVFDHYGVESARGSSTRGGTTALREMIRDARAGKNIVFTPDGPKGPNRVVKAGLVLAAQAIGAKLRLTVVGTSQMVVTALLVPPSYLPAARSAVLAASEALRDLLGGLADDLAAGITPETARTCLEEARQTVRRRRGLSAHNSATRRFHCAAW